VSDDIELEGARTAHLTVAGEDAGIRLDRVLAARIADLSRSRLKALVLAGRVTIGGRTILDPGHKVNAGDTVAIEIPAPEPAVPEGENIPLSIAYEDDDLIVIDKPAGLVVHPAAGHWTGTLVNALIAHCGASLSGIGGVRRPGIVHRLDKDTTGLLVVAKNDNAHRALTAEPPLPRLRLGRAARAPRHHRPADRPPSPCPRPYGDPRQRPGSHHPLAGAGALPRSGRRAGRLHA
jgi:23S rRNA pseudouridine1911/1915/1917 synthase